MTPGKLAIYWLHLFFLHRKHLLDSKVGKRLEISKFFLVDIHIPCIHQTLSFCVFHSPWFAQAEALFTAQNATQDETKFGHVVRVLPAPYASEECDIILWPLEQPYKVLKADFTCLPFKTTTTAAAPS